MVLRPPPKNRRERRHGPQPPKAQPVPHFLLELKRVTRFFFSTNKPGKPAPRVLEGLSRLPDELPNGEKPVKSGSLARMSVNYPCSSALVLNMATGYETRIVFTHTAKGTLSNGNPGVGDPSFTIHAPFGHKVKMSLSQFRQHAAERLCLPKLPDLMIQEAEARPIEVMP